MALYFAADMRQLRLKPYADQVESWPERGRVILAHYDDETVVVYLACRPRVSRYAVENGKLGGPLSFDRTVWIGPSFLWAMRYSDWGAAPDRSAILALWLRRVNFDGLLAQAVNTQYSPAVYPSKTAWQTARQAAQVLFQWDSDFTPNDVRLKRRVIQLGLRGEALRHFATDWIQQVADITSLVREQLAYVADELLLTPAERVYPVKDVETARRLELELGGL